MQTDNTSISTYILIDITNNRQHRWVQLSQFEFLNKNYAYGLNHSKYRYIKKSEITNYE
jgi:hypothetical protein